MAVPVLCIEEHKDRTGLPRQGPRSKTNVCQGQWTKGLYTITFHLLYLFKLAIPDFSLSFSAYKWKTWAQKSE